MASSSTKVYDVTFLSSGHNVADARLHRLASVLVTKGLSVEVIAQGESVDSPPGSKFVKAGGGRNLLSRVVRALKLPWAARGKVLIAIDPDLIPIALIAARMRRRQIVVDVHEDYLALLRDRVWANGLTGIGARAVASLASRLAERADLTIVADLQVPPLTARHRLVVRNFPDLQIPNTDVIEKSPRAVYVGDVRSSRGLGNMLRMIEATQAAGTPWRLDVIGPIAPADQSYVDRWLSDSPARELVTFYGRLTPAASWERALGAWVGLSLLESTPAFMDAIPTKIYEYAAAHLAVLTSPLPRPAALVTQHSFGHVVGDSDAAAAALITWVHDPEALLACRKSAANWAAGLEGSGDYGQFVDDIVALSRSKGSRR